MERIKQMPIPKHPRRILAHHPQRDRKTKRQNQRLGLALRLPRRVLPYMQRPNRIRRRHARRKDQLEFENVKLAQGDRESEPEKGTADRKGEEATNVLAGGAKETELVGGGETGSEEEPERTCGARGGLNDVVFFGAEVAAPEVARSGGREWFEDGETKDGAKQGGAESPARLVMFCGIKARKSKGQRAYL